MVAWTVARYSSHVTVMVMMGQKGSKYGGKKGEGDYQKGLVKRENVNERIKTKWLRQRSKDSYLNALWTIKSPPNMLQDACK